MFQSAYQDGDCVEVFSPAGKNPAADWKLSGKVVRMYEKGVKGYVLAVSGGATSKMQLPKAPKSLLGLRQRHLVLQVLTSTSQDKPFSLELGLTDTSGTRRRLVLSSSFRALHCTPLHAQIPLVGLERYRGSWANLTIDLVGLTAVCFKADDFRTLDLLAIGPTCRLRKVFTMKEALDDSSGSGGGDGQSENISAGGASGQNNDERCESAPVAPMPLRMAFPAGVVPAPQNWVISVSTLRRLASRDVPPPSPSKRNSLVATSSAKGRKNRPTSSLQESSFKGDPLSVSPAMAPLCIPEEPRSFRSSRGGATERGTPSPRLLEIVAGKPLSSSSSRASSTGTLRQQRSISSRASRNSSSRPVATSSPLATPARRRSTGTVVTCTNSRTPSSTSSTPRLPTPDRGSVRDGSSARLVGKIDGVTVARAIGGSSTPLGKTGMGDITSVCRALSRAATAEAGTPSCTPRRTPSSMAGGGVAAGADENTRDEPKGTGRKGGDLLPARLRASKASLSSSRTREVGHTEVAEDGGDRGEGGEGDGRIGDGRIARGPPAEWRVAGNWNGRQEIPAPAWSLFDDSSPDDGFRAVTPQAKHAYSIQAEEILPVPTTARCGTSGSHATASIADHENFGAASELASEGLGGGVRVVAGAPSFSPQPSPEVPANIDVTWLERQTREDGGAVAATSPEARDNASASSRFRPWSSAAIDVSAATTADNPSAFDPPNTSFAADAVVRHIEDGDKETGSATRANLFASPFSPREETSAFARRSPLSAGDARHSGKMQRSPMSARVDVLQNLLAPGVMGGEDLRPQNGSGNKRDKPQVSRTETEALPDSIGVADDADALEHLLVHSTINVDTGSSIRSDNGSPGTNCASSPFDAIVRPANCGPDPCVVSSSRDDHRDEGGTIHHRTIATKEITAVPTQVARTHTDVHTGLAALDGGRVLAGQATSLSPAEERGVAADTSRKDTRRGNIGENNDREEIGGLSSTCEEGAKGVLESAFCRMHTTSRERGHGEIAEPPMMAVDRSGLEELERKESALLDLEESYHTEFGSVDLSQSPDKHDFFAGNRSPDRASAPAENLEAEVHSSMKTDINRRRKDRGGPDESCIASSLATSIETSSRQRVTERDGDHDDDVDSVVLGSRGSTSSPAPREEEGGEKTRSRQGGGRGKDDELYFDPVLNCYYDRAADKYYELR
ncbi:unnamed protein product [Ectocarpus fasciculatus]